MAYRAEIEIGVKGARQLKELQDRIEKIANEIDLLGARDLFETGVIQNIKSYNAALKEAENNLRSATIGSKEETNAITAYVEILDKANAARSRQNDLIRQQTAAQRAAERTTVPGQTGFSAAQYGPAAPSGLIRSAQVQQSWNRFFAEAEEVAKLSTARVGAVKQSWRRFFVDAEETANELRATAITRESRIKQSWNKFFAQAEEVAQDLTRVAKRTQAETTRAGQTRFGAAVVGGGFPLLFGGGPGAVLGGALGGALGGKRFGFEASLGLSTLGTVLDRLVGSARTLGDALETPETALEKLQEVGFKVSASTQAQVESLIEAGNRTEAYNLLLKETGVRPEQVNALRDLDKGFDELQNELAGLFVTVASELTPAIVVVVNLIKDFVGALTGPDIQRAAANLDPQAFQEAQTKAATKFSSFGVIGDRRAYNELLTELSRDIVARVSPALKSVDPRGAVLSAEAKAKAAEKAAAVEKRLQRELQKLERDRINAREKADRDRYKALQDQLRLEQAVNDAALATIKEEGRRLEKQKDSRKELLRTQIKLFDVQTPLADELLGPQEAIKYKLDRLKETKILQDELFRIERLAAEVEAQRNNPATLNNVVQTYELLAQIRESEYQSARRILEADQARLQVYGAMASLSAAAGFQVSGELPGAFVPKGAAGILGPGAGLTDFMTGAELAPIIEQEVALARVLEKYQEIGQAAQLTSELVTTGFIDMVSGTRSAEEVFANFLNSLADMLIRTAQQMIAQYIAIGIARMFAMGGSPSSAVSGVDLNQNFFTGPGVGFGGFKAMGGPVSGGTPYIVGERGPELFVPSNSGTVVPNNALGGNVSIVVNVTEGQTDVRGGDGQANQLGKSIAAAVQSELIKQKRPGGLLAR